jgi:preprotein translocase subunit SecA
MSYIRETINWRSYGQQNPLVEYNLEAFKSFNLIDMDKINTVHKNNTPIKINFFIILLILK